MENKTGVDESFCPMLNFNEIVNKPYKRVEPNEKLKIVHFQLIFKLMAGSLAICIVAFFCELIVFQCHNRKGE